MNIFFLQNELFSIINQDETNFKEGKFDGVFRAWYDNGQLEYEQNWKDVKPDGVQREWYENGQFKSEGNWKEGNYVINV